jgi:hypothetical protein
VGLLVWISFLTLEILFRLILVNSGANANGSTLGTVLPLAVLSGLFICIKDLPAYTGFLT